MGKRDNKLMENYYTVDEASEQLGVTRMTIYRLIGRAILTPIKAGAATLFRREEVERVKQDREQE